MDMNIDTTRLVYQIPHNGIQTKTIHITNTSSERPLVYKVKTTKPRLFTVHPNASSIKPGSTLEVTISRNGDVGGESEGEGSRDKFLILGAIVSEAETNEPSVELWKRLEANSQNFFSQRVSVVYEHNAHGGLAGAAGANSSSGSAAYDQSANSEANYTAAGIPASTASKSSSGIESERAGSADKSSLDTAAAGRSSGSNGPSYASSASNAASNAATGVSNAAAGATAAAGAAVGVAGAAIGSLFSKDSSAASVKSGVSSASNHPGATGPSIHEAGGAVGAGFGGNPDYYSGSSSGAVPAGSSSGSGAASGAAGATAGATSGAALGSASKQHSGVASSSANGSAGSTSSTGPSGHSGSTYGSTPGSAGSTAGPASTSDHSKLAGQVQQGGLQGQQQLEKSGVNVGGADGKAIGAGVAGAGAAGAAGINHYDKHQSHTGGKSEKSELTHTGAKSDKSGLTHTGGKTEHTKSSGIDQSSGLTHTGAKTDSVQASQASQGAAGSVSGGLDREPKSAGTHSGVQHGHHSHAAEQQPGVPVPTVFIIALVAFLLGWKLF